MTAVGLLFFVGIFVAALWPTPHERADRADLRSIDRQHRATRALRTERETTREAPRVARRTTAV